MLQKKFSILLNDPSNKRPFMETAFIRIIDHMLLIGKEKFVLNLFIYFFL